MRLTWLADVLRGAGLTVIEHDGWEARGKDLREVLGVVFHHTASGPAWSDSRVAKLLIDGRSDLPGPLCQLGLDRTGRYHVIAAGKGNHNGYGTWGNQSIGIEAFNDGVGEPWPDAQVRAYCVGSAAILQRLGMGATQVRGHKETDPARKIDPTLDMSEMRARIVLIMRGQAPTPLPTPEPGDTFMAALTDSEQRELLTMTRENNLRLVEIQAEVVGTKDAKGRSRMDRLSEMISRLAGKG